MNHPKIWEEVRKLCYEKDWDNKIGRSPALLADDIMAAISPLLELPKEEPKPEHWVTIAGVKYRLDEIK